MKQTKQHAKDSFKHYLSAKGLKSTVQRNIILDAFMDLDRHVYVDELYLVLRREHPSIGLATVYRALKLFAESGMAREIKLGDGVTRYEHATAGTRHEHLVCTVCAGITEFETPAIEQLQEEIVGYGFHLETMKLELRGVCMQCLGRHPER